MSQSSPVRCPHCGRVVASEPPQKPASFPFCNQRCRLLDLGAWLDGKHAIPGSPADDSASHPPHS